MSQLFEPFRELGRVCDGVPFYTQKRGKKLFLYSSVGRAFHVYDAKKLDLRLISSLSTNRIHHIAARGDFTYIACGYRVLVYFRHKLIHSCVAHNQAITAMLLFGEHLVTCGRDGLLKLWPLQVLNEDHSAADTVLVADDSDSEADVSIELGRGEYVTHVLHPDTYLNKLLVSTNTDQLYLYNVRSCQRIYAFNRLQSTNADSHASSVSLSEEGRRQAALASLVHSTTGTGTGTSTSTSTSIVRHITCLEQSPAVDVVAIGYSDGCIDIRNLRTDQSLIQFHHSGTSLSTLAFRTDGTPHLVSSGDSGTIAVWDLQSKTIKSLLPGSDAPTVHMEYIPNTGVLLVQTNDNRLAQYVFDRLNHQARVLRQRSGHKSSPNKLLFYNDKELLSGGADQQLRSTSIIQEKRNMELSQKNALDVIHKSNLGMKLAPVVDVAANSVREWDWSSVVSCHKGDNRVYTWKYLDKTSSAQVLLPPAAFKQQTAEATACCISACGNFAYVGRADGVLDVYNIQSAIHRSRFTAHDKPITGCCVDPLNTLLVTTSLDGSVAVWHRSSLELRDRVHTGSAVALARLASEAGLLAAVCDDLHVRLFDIYTNRLVRSFGPMRSRISDASFTTDCRLLCIGCHDGTVYTYDIPTGRLIDWWQCSHPVSALAFSPDSQYLVTSHPGSLGLHVWLNRNFFIQVFLRPVPATPLRVHFAQAVATHLQQGRPSGEGTGTTATATATATADHLSTSEAVVEELAHQFEQLLHYSTVAKPQWQTLNQLEAIKERNKPKQPVEKPADVPFFLSTTISSADHPMQFLAAAAAAAPAAEVEGGDGGGDGGTSGRKRELSRIQHHDDALSSLTTPFQQLLQNCMASNDFQPAVQHLSSLSASGVDFELQSCDRFESLQLLLQLLLNMYERNEGFELCESYLRLVLRVHGDLIMQDETLLRVLVRIQELHGRAWNGLQQQLQRNLSLLQYLGDFASA